MLTVSSGDLTPSENVDLRSTAPDSLGLNLGLSGDDVKDSFEDENIDE